MTKEELILRKEQLQQELKKVDAELSNCELTNEEWFKYGVKTNYPYLSRVSDELREVIDGIGWDRYETITLENILDRFEEEENTKEFDDLCNLLQKDNFGSVCCDW